MPRSGRRGRARLGARRRTARRGRVLRTELGDVEAELPVLFFLPFLDELLLEKVPSILAVPFVPTRPSSFFAATVSRNFFWGSVSLTPGAFLGAAFLAPALGVALASAFWGAAFLGAAFLTAGLAFSVFVPLLGAVDFFTAIAITSLLNMFACLRPALIERSLRQFIPNL